MRFQGALVREQGVEFAIIIVKRPVVEIPAQRESRQRAFRAVFPGVPVVLMAQDARGTPTYWGRLRHREVPREGPAGVDPVEGVHGQLKEAAMARKQSSKEPTKKGLSAAGKALQNPKTREVNETKAAKTLAAGRKRKGR